ncbi:hypothetical protein EDC96DRAFT_558843 [Choanephora cucurbitarum]|nr:hypothetical protein EDC96DRAFT_558843 [Choanephora cucurbitarum]
MRTSAKLIGNLVHRVSVRLPYKSGRKLDTVEQDPIVKQTVAAIVELSKFKLSTIANSLGYVLESMSKGHQLYEQSVSVDIMQSELFILRLLSACTQHHWQHCRELEAQKNPDTPFNLSRNVLPPLDAALVSFLLMLLGRYVSQYHSLEESTNIATGRNPPSFIDYGENESGYSPEQIRFSLLSDVYKEVSKVLYYISASNWEACYAKIKNAIISLDSINASSEEIPSEIRMLGSSCLTRDRLFAIFTELSPYYLHMRHEGKLLFSKMIRRAIWKWIEELPMEYAEVCAGVGRSLSGSEVLFDMCNSTADNPRKRAILWPLQTILLSLSPELLMQAFLDTAPTHNRRANFLSLLRKSLQTTRNVDIAAVCYVDLCKAATFVPPDNDSVLRSIAADVQAELKDKVWDFTRSSNSDSTLNMSGYTIDQQKLTTDFLLSRLRLRPEDTLKNIIPSCVHSKVHIRFKMALVKVCLIIAQDENNLAWNPTISSMYNGLCTPLRTLFFQAVNNELTNGVISKRKDTSAAYLNRAELLLDMLELFHLEPSLALLGDDDDRLDQNIAFMSALASLIQHPIQRIRQDSLDLLLKMHHVDIIPHWGPGDNYVYNFGKVGAPVVLNISKQILDARSNEDYHKTLLQFAVTLFKARYAFLKSKKEILPNSVYNLRERLQAAIAIEIAVLISLCSPNKEVCDEALRCIGSICKEARMINLSDDEQAYSLSMYSNIKVYEGLSADDSRFVGRKAQQKKIRKFIRMFPEQTPGNMAAWEEAWNRWKQLTVLINRIPDDTIEDDHLENSAIQSSMSSTPHGGLVTITNTNSTSLNNSNSKKLPLARTGGDKMTRNGSSNSTLVISSPKPQPSPEFFEEKAAEWQNYTGFLAALGGCCLLESRNAKKTNSIMEHSRRISSSEPAMMVDRFVSDMVDLLVCDNVRLREGIKDIIGNDLSPALYVSLFRHFDIYMGRCFNSNGEAIRSPQNKLFVEQTVLSLRLILDRLVNPSDCLLNVDFGVLMNKAANYLNGLPNTYITMRIKIKMCFFIEAIMQKKEQIIIQDEMRLRNKLLEIIVEWTSDFMTPAEVGQHVDRLQKDLDQACLKAIVSLLKQLPLQPPEAVRPEEIVRIKSKMFLKYFSFFRKLLDRYKQSERDISKPTVSGPVSSQLLSPRDSSFKPVASGSTNASTSDSYADIGHLKELTILAMSRLLSANVDAGLKYSLSMAYDEDHETRKAFMQVLTNILDHGTEFETLAEDVMIDRYEKLIDMLVDSDMDIVMSLCEVCPSPDTTDVAEVLLICFESRSKVMPLLRAVVQREISMTEQEATLFRGTTMATRILSIFAKLSCLDYIRITLQPAMEAINALPDDQLTWELDPTKISPNEEIAKNKKNVVRATEIFLDAICNSVNNAPKAFREELALITEAVSSRFPEAKSTAVGGFVFLRLFGPAILTPEQAGFSKQALPRNINVRKILLQATRIMQNLANNVLFGSKETHMIVLNDFLTSNIYKVTSFLRAISVVPADMADSTAATFRMDQSGYVRLHKYLYDNLERMSRDLTTRRLIKSSSDDQTQSLLNWKRTLDRLSSLLAQLGTPAEISSSNPSYTRNYTVANSSHVYNELMRRNGHRDVSSINGSNMFYLGGPSKDGRPVFYMICRDLDVEETDYELLTYYMLRIMEPYLNQPFEFLFDLTEFTSSRSIPINFFTQFFQLVLSEMNDYLVTLHLYNPTIFMAKRIRQLPRDIVNKLVKRAKFHTSLAELSEVIAPNQIKLPKQTMDMERENYTTISPVSRISNLKSSLPVTVKIGEEHIQIVTVKKQEIINNLITVYRDVLHISDISDIIPLPSSKPENGGEVSIKYDKGKSIMILSTAKRDMLVQLLRQTKQRYESSQPSSISERVIRPNDVPGRLLNMALVNIGSEHPGLRLTAYNLLYSLSVAFRFDTGNQLLRSKDLCIPSNSSNFIVNISESLAQSEMHLTLEFLNEALTGLLKCDDSMRQLCLDYMAPWLNNLAVYARHSPDDHKKNLAKTKDVIKLLIDLTVQRSEMYKHIQTKVWKTLGQIDEIANLVIDCFIQYSVENGVGSPQAEIIADTLVTMSSISIRGKVISRMRRVIEQTSVQPCRHLIEHASWDEIAVLLRFILMLSFNSTGPVVPHIPEIFHIVSLLVVTGPTLIRSSVHELVVNTIHNLCTIGVPLAEDNIKKLHFVLNDVCDSKNRVSFGLTKQHANAFTITKETTTDFAEAIDLTSLQHIIRLLLDALNFGAPTIDIANMWRARWMGLVTSTAFYFNPAIQPRSFVTLGCLAQDEVDDDLIYQILVALKGALAIFNETDSSLIVSIIMCLSNIIDHLPANSQYLLQLFWLAIALVQVGHASIFQTAVQFLQSVLRALDARNLFVSRSIEDVLLEARAELGDVARELDDICGVNFNNYFSFAIAVLLLKGFKYSENKDTVLHCMTAFLEIDCKQPVEQSFIEARTLGYLTGLLPFASKDDTLRELLRLAGINDTELGGIDFGVSSVGLFGLLEIPDNSTALLLVSLLVTLLNTSDNESEKLFLYSLLADAAVTVPEVFALVYESLLPKMNQMVMNCQNQEVVEAIKCILLTACSEPAFDAVGQASNTNKRTQRWGLESLRFSALCDPNFGAFKTDIGLNAKLASKLLGSITDQQ